jgi:outer membrane protein
MQHFFSQFNSTIKSRYVIFIVFISTTSFATLALAAAPTLGGDVLVAAENLIRKGEFEAAYQLLEPIESLRAGEPEYDYLLGIAGVESGAVTRGAFALERVLATNPNNKDARAEIAKAHFLLGEYESAREEFKEALQQNPNPEARKSIEKMLLTMDKRQGIATTFGAYLDAGYGWDSNVSSAPGISSTFIPGLAGPFDLGNAAQENSDSFMNFTAGASFRHPVTNKLALYGGASYNKRFNTNEKSFNTSALDFNIAAQFKLNTGNILLGLQDNHFELDGNSFRHAYGGSAQWLYNINGFNQVGAYGQYTRLDYADGSDKDADRKIIGLNVGHVFQGDYNPVAYASLYGGREDMLTSARPDLGQDIYGLRTGGQLSYGQDWSFYGSLAYETRRNDENDRLFAKKRKDDQYDGSLGLRFVPAPYWSIKPQFSYTKNNSNIDINGYVRKAVSINVRRDFDW